MHLDIKKALVVDDLYENRLLLTEMLGMISVKAETASNGKEALDYLKEKSVDIIFMDLDMPVINGVEATKSVRSQKDFTSIHDIPIIAITAHDPKEFFKNYSDAGFNALISKPYTVEKLHKMLDFFVEEEL